MENRDTKLIWESYASAFNEENESSGAVYVVQTRGYYDEGGDLVGVFSGLEGIEDAIVQYAREDANVRMDAQYDIYEFRLNELNDGFENENKIVATINPRQAGRKEKKWDPRDQPYSDRYKKDPLDRGESRITSSGKLHKGDQAERKKIYKRDNWKLSKVLGGAEKRGVPKGPLPENVEKTSIS